MPKYRIHRLKESRRTRFRSAPHTSGEAVVLPSHYEAGGLGEAPTPYALWSQMSRSDRPLMVGDMLETGEGGLWIFKYVGFEKACWETPTEKAGSSAEQELNRTA